MANKKRKEMTLARYSDLSLSNAREEAAIKMKQFRDGLDPLIAKKRAQQAELNTVNNLFIDWHVGNIKRLKHPEIPKRIYRKDIAPHIGDFRIDSVTARDIRAILNTIAASGRPAIANDALMYCKQLFNHGIKLDLLSAKPASAFLVSHAGGVEKSKDRALTIEELTQFFKVARENSDSLSRENYLACALLVTLGVRKSELVEAKWNEFDLDKKSGTYPKSLVNLG